MKRFLSSKFFKLFIFMFTFIAICSNVQITSAEEITFQEFSLPNGVGDPSRITSGSNGNIWFIEESANKIGKIAPNGNITEYIIPTSNSSPAGITSDPDGNIWFTEYDGNKVGKISSNGTITEYLIPTINSNPVGIVSGSDGNIWFTERSGKIGKITSDGVITEFTINSNNRDAQAITLGPDGNLWFTTSFVNIGKITPSGSITLFQLPSGAYPNYITSGKDGNLWFTVWYPFNSINPQIGKITPDGTITWFTLPIGNNNQPVNITSDTNGNLWFTLPFSSRIGKMTLSGSLAYFLIPTEGGNPQGITSGSDENIWFTEESAHKIVRVNLSGATPTPTPTPTISVKDYKQTDPQWSTLPSLPENASTHLNHLLSCGDIYLFGCAVTSVADVLYSYGKTTISNNIQLQPGNLNDWLTNNNGFKFGCSIIWPNLSSKVDLGAPRVLFNDSPSWSSSSQAIDAALAVGNLPIVGVYTIYGTHFIVLSSKLPDVNGKPDYRIVDPALYPFSANVIGKTGQALSQAYGGWDNVFQYVIYKKDSAKQRTLTIQAHSPVQLVITDPFGNVTGYDSTTQQIVENIPDSSYGVEPGIAPVDGSAPPMEETKYFQQIDPTEGDYELQVVGTGNGNYNLDLSKTDENGNVSIATVNGIAQQGITENYQVDYIPNATDPVITKKEVTFDSLQSDLKGLYMQEEIKNKGIYVALKVEIEAAERASNIDKQPLGNKLAIAALKAIQFELKIYRGRQITEDAYQLLFTDIDSLITSLQGGSSSGGSGGGTPS